MFLIFRWCSGLRGGGSYPSLFLSDLRSEHLQVKQNLFPGLLSIAYSAGRKLGGNLGARLFFQTYKYVIVMIVTRSWACMRADCVCSDTVS